MAKFAKSGFAAFFLLGYSPAAEASTMYIVDTSYNLGTVDTATGAATVIGNTGVELTDIAFDPMGNLFGISYSNLYSIDATTAAISSIGAHGIGGGNALTFGTDGTLYAAGGWYPELYTLNTSTGAGASLGTTGFYSSGDLTFAGGSLYLATSFTAGLASLDLGTLANSTLVGPFGVSSVFGIATDDTSSVYGVAATSIYSINTATGAATNGVSYAGQGLSDANGQAFFTEAGANPADDPNATVSAVPLPASLPLLLGGLFGVGAIARRKKKNA